MIRITFIAPGKGEYAVDAQPGQSVMEAATGNLVPGIVGECGGACACATCHVHVDEPWCSQLAPADEMERGMLEGALDTTPQSRLSCQIKVSAALDGAVMRIPASQW